MKIIKVKVNWNQRVANSPIFHLVVDKIPKRSELRYQQYHDIYCAEKGGYVSLLRYSEPSHGLNGDSFYITLKSGGKKFLKGPWVPNVAQINGMGLGPYCEVVVNNLYIIAVTLELAIKAADMVGCKLAKEIQDNGECEWIPSIDSSIVCKPERFVS
jgi:hypothetical protein